MGWPLNWITSQTWEAWSDCSGNAFLPFDMDLWGGSLASAALLLPCDAVTRMRGISGLGWAIWALCAIRSHLTGVWECSSWSPGCVLVPSKMRLVAAPGALLLKPSFSHSSASVEHSWGCWLLNQLYQGTCYVSFSTWNPWKEIRKTSAPWSVMDSVGKLCSSFWLSSEL